MRTPTQPSPKDPPGHPMSLVDLANNRSYVVDVVVLRDLRALVGRAIARRDGSELREFIASRRAAYMHLRDSKPTRLEPKKLVTALADIGALDRTVLARQPEARALLDAARTTPTHAREVSRDAMERLVSAAERLRTFIQLKAPHFITMTEVRIISNALGAIDTFDFTVRSSANYEPKVLGDEELVEAALACSYVADAEDSCMGIYVGRPFVRAPELFPRPTDPERMAGWERFCGSVPYISPPRVVYGADIAATSARVVAFSQFVQQDLTLGKREKENALWFIGNHNAWLHYAARNNHAVVEWVRPYDEDAWRFVTSSCAPRAWALPGVPSCGDARLEILAKHLDPRHRAHGDTAGSPDDLPLGFPAFLEPPPRHPEPTPAPAPWHASERTLLVLEVAAFLGLILFFVSFASVLSSDRGMLFVMRLRHDIVARLDCPSEHPAELRALDRAYARALVADAYWQLERGDEEGARARFAEARRYDPETVETSREVRQAGVTRSSLAPAPPSELSP